jgi:hypothetical protein
MKMKYSGKIEKEFSLGIFAKKKKEFSASFFI